MQGMLLEIKLNRDGSMSIKKNIIKLNKFFQPDEIIFGEEEKNKSTPLKKILEGALTRCLCKT